MDHPGRYEICPVCGWEDDVVQNDDPNLAGGANQPSLYQAIHNFNAFGAVEERKGNRTRAPWPEEIPAGR